MPNDFIKKDRNLNEKIQELLLFFGKILIFYYNFFFSFCFFLAHYRPVEPNKQSFIYNAAGKWI